MVNSAIKIHPDFDFNFCFVLQGESNVQEIKEQLEALTAHVDYVQENITDCQTSIMEMEV